MGRYMRKHRAYDQRTGRLERALDLIEDGDVKGLKVHRREADPEHPLRRPFRVGADRANLFPGLLGERTYEDAQMRFSYGYTLGANLWEQRTLPIIAWGIGGFVLSATIVNLDPDLADTFLLEDGLSSLLLEDGGSYLILE